MKKLLCLILTLALTFSCFCFADLNVAGASFETENGIQVEIAPFLYKSTLYQMEFPSHQSYSIKEKSVVGDYAISREINDTYVGKRLRVLVGEEENDRSYNNEYTKQSRTEGFKLVYLRGAEGLEGQYADIVIEKSSTWALFGAVVKD